MNTMMTTNSVKAENFLTSSATASMKSLHGDRPPCLIFFLHYIQFYTMSRDSSVDIATGCMTQGSELDSGGVKNFLFSTSSGPALGPTQPPTIWEPVALTPGKKRQGCEADHSPPSSAEVKKRHLYTYCPYVFIAVDYSIASNGWLDKDLEGARGSAVVKALCCKPEGRGSRPDEMDYFLIYLSFRPHYGRLGSTQPLTEMSTRNL
jgi:hypothetical protein